MKVLTIKEPWASLIIGGYKKYEFRSWKTNYRGKILIHAGMSTESNMIERFKNYNLDIINGAIIGEAELVDSILIDDKFNEELCKTNMLVYGRSTHTGLYAWKLENVVKYDKPIKVKGMLGLWNYYDELEVMDLMKDIKYGYVNNDSKLCTLIDDNFTRDYVLQSPLDVIKNKIGVCWDQVELERYYFKNSGLIIKTYFIIYYDNDRVPTHTFLTFQKNNKYYWFEHSWQMFAGIYEYDTLEELLIDVKGKFARYEISSCYDEDYLVIYEYEIPKFNITAQEFCSHCENGNKIII